MNDFFTPDGDYYQILEIERTATKDDIKRAYRRLALIWHPDKHSAENQANANKKFILLKKAYDALIDDHSRILHDMMGPKAFGKQSDAFQSPFQTPSWGESGDNAAFYDFGPSRGNGMFTFLDDAFGDAFGDAFNTPSTMYNDIFGGDDLFLRRKYEESGKENATQDNHDST